MNNRTLTILGVIAAVMLSAALIQGYFVRHGAPEAPQSGPLIQGLDTKLIRQIVVGKPGSEITINWNEQNRRFELANKDNYPAKVAQINSLINACLDIQVSGRQTSNPANHADLEVSDEKAQNIVKIIGEKDKLITGLVMGKRAEGQNGAYVRRVGENDVYVGQQSGWIPTNLNSYYDQQLLELNKDNLAQVTVQGPGFEYNLTPDPNGKPQLKDKPLPAGKHLKDNALDPVFIALASLGCADVKKSAEGLNFDHVYTSRLKDSTVYTFKVAQKDGKSYATATAAFGDQSQVTISRQESQEELKKKEAKLKARDAADAFAKKHAGWVYELNSWQGENLTKKFDELIEDIPQPKPAETPAAAPAAAAPVPAPDPAPAH